MTRIDLLRKNFQRLCEYSWDRNVAGPQRVWIAIYEKEDERKLRLRLGVFEEATLQAGRKWTAVDLTDSFAEWMTGPHMANYAESYFANPESLDDAVLVQLKKAIAEKVRKVLADLPDPDNTVVALYGVGSLFGFLKVSEVVPMLEGSVKGRLLVFFPGVYEQNNFKFFDARDGWNYHAVPITAADEGRS